MLELGSSGGALELGNSSGEESQALADERETAEGEERDSELTHCCFRRAGELNPDELERIVTIIQNPTQFKIPNWFMNRQKDIVDGKYGQLLSNQLDSKVRSRFKFRLVASMLTLLFVDARGSRATQEDPNPSWSPTLLGSPCSRTAPENYRTSRTYHGQPLSSLLSFPADPCNDRVSRRRSNRRLVDCARSLVAFLESGRARFTVQLFSGGICVVHAGITVSPSYHSSCPAEKLQIEY